jgi:hypothetical protein
MYDMGYKHVAVVTYANAFSKAHTESFKANFKGAMVSDQVIQDDNEDIQPYITSIKAAKPDAIYAPDASFFLAGATAKLKQAGLSKVPVFTTYVAELPTTIPLMEGVMYSFPADVGDGAATSSANKGAVYELSKQTTETLVPIVLSCGAEPLCVKGKLSSTGKFDGNGVFKRDLILKKVVKGTPVILNSN